MLDQTKRTMRRLTYLEKYTIHDMLKPLIIRTSDGHVEYRPQWSDKEVLRALQNSSGLSNWDGITEAHIAAVRRELFGNFKIHKGGKGNGIKARLAALEQWRDEVIAKIGSLL